jgi:pre-mRNA-splicing factor ISY1
MARPAEKARSMLNKWVKMREEGNAPAMSRRGRRPILASECQHLADAEHYRNQIIREISVGIAKIQNPALGEHTIRDLNDDINKKLREKYHWNKRIKELGGLDFNAIEKQRQIEQGEEGNQALEANGYKYFGAAKDLPGVKELFEKQTQKLQSRKRGDIVKNITPAYYGWRDEEDGVLLELEEAEHQRRKRRKRESGDNVSEVKVDCLDDYLDIPSQDEISQILLEEKKKALLAKFSF